MFMEHPGLLKHWEHRWRSNSALPPEAYRLEEKQARKVKGGNAV